MINWNFLKKNIALIYKNNKYLYNDILLYINKAEIFLTKANIKRGDRVILLGENSLEFIILIFAINNIGAIFVILDSQSNNKRLQYIFDDILASIIIIDDEIYAKKQSLIKTNFTKSILTKKILLDIEKYEKNIEIKEIDKNAIATIIYTSGSTGNPKGIVSLNKNILFSVEKINNRLNYGKEDIVLSGLPFSFDYGLYQIFLTFSVGATLLLEKNFDNILNIPSILYKYKVSIFPIVPTIIKLLLSTKLLERLKLPYLKKITSTGEVLDISVIKKLQKLFPNIIIFPMYGITECKRVAIMPKGMLSKKIGSVGKAIDDIEISLTDSGELLVKGENVMFGYWNEDKISKSGTYFLDRLLYTGDYFMQDSDGYLYFLGRKDDLIKINGKRINLKEIESYFIERYQSIKEIGIKYYNNNLYIFIFGDLDKHRVRLNLKENFYINIKENNIFMQNIPLLKNTNGKIDKNGLFKQYL